MILGGTMKTVTAAAFSVAVLLVGCASAPPPPLPPGTRTSFPVGRVELPQVMDFPGRDEVQLANPQRARELGQEAWARVTCIVAADNALKNCAVTAESDASAGYGQAALGLMDRYQFAAAHIGKERFESVVTIPIDFGAPMTARLTDGTRLAYVVKGPTAAQKQAAYPDTARFFGVGGYATLTCTVTVQGRATDCVVRDESDAALGFADAALSLVDTYEFKPAMKDGQLISSITELTVNFVGDESRRALRQGPNRVARVDYAAAPSKAEVEAAYRAQFGDRPRTGRTQLRCVVGPVGALTRCEPTYKAEADADINKVAMSLVGKFLVGRDYDREELPLGDTVLVPFAFEGDVATPWLTWGPTSRTIIAVAPAEARGLENMKAAVTCTVGAGGAMGECHVTSESTPGVRLGDTALGLAQRYRAELWARTGQPSEGREINAKFDFAQGALSQRPDSMADMLARSGVALVTAPDWEGKPSGRDVEDFYPPAALYYEVNGMVRLACKVQDTGATNGCYVMSEAPNGFGFGEAALSIAPLFKMKPATLGGKPVSGHLVVIPVGFSLR